MDNGASSYRRYLDGDDSGLVELVRDYKDGLILYLNGITGNFCLAEELMEDTFFKLAAKKPKFSGKSSFKTWLYSIASPQTTSMIFPMSATSSRITCGRNKRSHFIGQWLPSVLITDKFFI